MNRRISTPVLFVCCWCTYLTAYLCRVNFSTALSALAQDLSIPVARLGTVGACFFVVYAIGQLVNGFLGDRVPPARFLLIALTGTAACNACVALVRSYGGVLLFWSLNGYFQSIFWSTIIRLMAMRIPAERRASVSTGISTCMPIGYILSWSVLGQALADGPSFPFFAIPAACAVLMLICWPLMAKQLTPQEAYEGPPPQSVAQTARFIAQKGLIPVIGLCVCHGLIKEGVAFWFPLMLTGFITGTTLSPALLLTTVPLANMFGMFLSKWMLGRGRPNPYAVLAVFFFASAGICCLLSVAKGALLIIALIALVSCLSCAANTVLMSFLPMQYTAQNMVASLAGLFDFAAYMGAALSTYALSGLVTSGGFAGLPLIWMGAALVAATVGLFLFRRHNLRREACA